MANQVEVDAVRGAANDAAQNAYNQGMLELGNQTLAFNKAKQAWQETMDKSGLTGTFEGMPTQAALQFGATQFGTWGAPQQGAETLQSKQQTFQQGQDVAGLYGANYGPGGPGQGTQTLAGQQQGFTQGLQTQQEQRAAQAQQQSQAQQYLNLLSSLRGPADWAKYQQVLGSTPGGMRDLVGAAMGQYVPGGGATTGYQPQAVSLQSMMGQVTGQGYEGQGGGPLNMPDVYGQNSQGMYQQQPNPNQALYQQSMGGQPGAYQASQLTPQQQQVQQMFQPPPGTQGAQVQNYGGYGPTAGMPPKDPSQNRPMDETMRTQQMLQGQLNPQVAGEQRTQQQYQNQQMPPAAGNGTNMMGAQQPGQPQANQMNLPAPNQIAAQSWNNLAPSQKEMLMGQYEAQGWHKPDVEALRTQALPKYAANAPTAGTFRMR